MIFSKYSLILIAVTAFRLAAFSQPNKYIVSSQSEFNEALNTAVADDSIVWKSGTYNDIFMDLDKDGVIVTAGVNGGVIMQGASKVEIPANRVTLSGIQFVGGDIGTDHVIRIDGSHILITQINIDEYTCHKYLIIDELSQYVTVSYSNFENRINYADQNILSILVDDTNPGYHKIQYCSFKNFEGGGNDEGVEPIRIGVSTQSEFNSRSIVEYCYFTQCDGDGEIISNKASQNVIRYNTFESNSKAEVVLRHGNEAIVYGNFFINNMGGVRVREGQNHFIFNNYFTSLDRRTIYLQNEASDPLDLIHIYFNTIINSAEILLGGDGGGNPPTNVVFANNIFTQPKNNLFEEATGNESWLGNLSFGSLGISQPTGMTNTDPLLEMNLGGFFELTTESPAINAAESGYPLIPTFENVDFDHEILLDLMKQPRQAIITMKDIGASEFSETVTVKPHVDEGNTGPSYLSDNPSFVLTTDVIGEGTIILDPPSGVYPEGITITLTAEPSDRNEFVEWGGDLSGSDNPQSVVINKNMEISATFKETPLSLADESKVGIFPNPSRNELNLQFNLEKRSRVILEVVDVSGLIHTLFDGNLAQGEHKLHEDISHLSTGVYFLHLNQYDSNDLLKTTILRFIKR